MPALEALEIGLPPVTEQEVVALELAGDDDLALANACLLAEAELRERTYVALERLGLWRSGRMGRWTNGYVGCRYARSGERRNRSWKSVGTARTTMSVPEEILIHTKLIGDRQVIAGLTAEVAAIEGVRTGLGTEFDQTSRRGFFFNQMLFTIRRFLHDMTRILGVATIAAVGFGLKFNALMQMNEIAMTHFLGPVTWQSEN